MTTTTPGDPNNPLDPNGLSYAFFEIAEQNGGSDVADGLWVVLTNDPNYCVPTTQTPGLKISTLKAGSLSLSVQIPAPLKGNSNGTFLGVKDYPTATLSVDTHASRGLAGLNTNTCDLFDGGPKQTVDLNVTAINPDATLLNFVLSGNIPTSGDASSTTTTPAHIVGAAKACTLMTSAILGYGGPTWLSDNSVSCTPANNH